MVHETHHMQFSMPVMPVPLSACFINVRRNGRADSERYGAYKRTVDKDLAQNWRGTLGTPYQPTFTGNVKVRYTVRRPDRRARDLDNLLKALNDTLTRNHIVQDDSRIIDLQIRWGSEALASGSPVFVEITEVA